MQQSIAQVERPAPVERPPRPETVEALEAELFGFIGSCEQYRSGMFPRLRYTEGIADMAKIAGAHWLIDIVGSVMHLPRVYREEFQLWRLYVFNGLQGHREAQVTMHADRGLPAIYAQQIEYTDFPIGTFEFYVCAEESDRVMMLKGEY